MITTRQKRWQVYPSSPELSRRISAHFNVHPVVGQLLLNRNIRSLSQADSFLNPAHCSPSYFSDDLMHPVLELIAHAIAHHWPILLYGDYDVDGMTSTSMMMEALQALGATVHYFLPHRFVDGYGVSGRIGDIVAHYDAKLLITLDCGITNVSEIAALKAHSDCRVIIVDHHRLPDELPAADAILNPKVLPSDHGLYGLCTAGIVYKVIEALAQRYSALDPSLFLDLAALGTVADVAPLIDENRRLVALGLEALAMRRRRGIRFLLEAVKFSKSTMTARDIGFVIAPCLNAAGRLEYAELGVKLLTSASDEEAKALADRLCRLNEQRRFIGESIMKESVDYIESGAHHEKPVIVVSDAHWHPGVIGIIASRLVDRYSRPVVMIAGSDSIWRGSARSIGDINIYALLKECSHCFSAFGGHKEAAGFSMDPAQIPQFETQLLDVCNARLSAQDLCDIVSIDAVMAPEDMTLELAQQLQGFEPFGSGNAAPVFYTQALQVLESKAVGDGSHLKVTFRDLSNRKVIDGIGFGLAYKQDMMLSQNTVELAFRLTVNEWMGRQLPQLELVDIQ